MALQGGSGSSGRPDVKEPYYIQAWEAKVDERRADGLCINCPDDDLQPATNGDRCGYHAEINRAKCLLWSRLHADEKSEYDKDRKAAWRAQNLCPICPEHRALLPGFKKCLECRVKHRSASKKKPQNRVSLDSAMRGEPEPALEALKVLRGAKYQPRVWNPTEALEDDK